jgi:nucleoside-diphosphate-sugar epimerase
MPNVLITGAAGRLGRAMTAGLLGAGLTVRGYDLRPAPGIDTTVGTLLDNALLNQAMANVDLLIHLAATPDDSVYPPGDSDNFESELLPNNVLGSYRVLEAARRAGVKRVMLASTGQVVDGHLDNNNTPVTANASYAPRYLYACTKVFLEQLGRVYAEHHGLSVLAVRFGWCPRDAKQVAEITADHEAQDVYLSPGDAGRCAVAVATTQRWPKFAPVYCTSLPTRHLMYDLAPAKNLLGFVPQDKWPTGAGEG